MAMAGMNLAQAAKTSGVDISLRREGNADQPFLSLLYASVRWDELAPTGWSDSQKTAFLNSQFAAQHEHFARQCAGADFHIIDHSSGPLGRLAVDRRAPERLHLLDIALLPSWRGQGIGSTLIKALIAEAGPRPLSLHVVKENPARSLYLRLGFQEIETRGFHSFMETSPSRNCACEAGL